MINFLLKSIQLLADAIFTTGHSYSTTDAIGWR